ncbi:MAG: sensor histidine kinase [Candidatus Binatia bacterium]
MRAGRAAGAASSWMFVVEGVGGILATLGMLAFNLGYLGLYVAFFPLLCAGVLLFVDIGKDFFLSLLFFASASALLYTVGLFALPWLLVCVIFMVPVAKVMAGWGIIGIPLVIRSSLRPEQRVVELTSIVLVALGARYLWFRTSGGGIPLYINEIETLSRFLFSEVVGWVVFALGYGVQHRLHYGARYSEEVEFARSLPALLATGLFLVSPHVAIMLFGLNTFGVTGLYLGALPVGAAHVLMWTLTMRRAEIERQNAQLHEMNVDLARNERLAAIGQMSSAISHQILQKVGLLGLQCDLLRETLRDQTASSMEVVAEAAERAKQVDDAITDLNTTLSDLLVFSRDFVLHRQATALEEILRDACREMTPTAEARGVEIEWCNNKKEKSVRVDAIKFKQALLNLITNAIEASPMGGRVSIVANGTGEALQLAISDKGTGIAEDHLSRIFSPFFSTKKSGTGLGLTFTQRIVELHGGTVKAENNLQGGATFIVEIPEGISP